LCTRCPKKYAMLRISCAYTEGNGLIRFKNIVRYLFIFNWWFHWFFNK